MEDRRSDSIRRCCGKLSDYDIRLERDRLDTREGQIAALEEQLAWWSLKETVGELALEVRESETQPPFFVRWYQ